MKKKEILFCLLMLMATIMTYAEGTGVKVYTYVQQVTDGTTYDITADGTAAFDISETSYPTLEFDASGNAVMTIGGNIVAKLPTTDGGQLCADFTTSAANLNKISKTIDAGFSYATIYSPFQLQMPATGGVVYAPTYDATNHVLQLNSETQVANGTVIPAGTGLLIASNVEFTFSAGASTDTHTSVLSGSALTIANPTQSAAVEGKTVYTLGQATGDTSKYGFFRYTGASLNPGLAYLYVSTVPTSGTAKYIVFSYDDIPMGNTVVDADTVKSNAKTFKYVCNGRVQIVGNGQTYNISGQELK